MIESKVNIITVVKNHVNGLRSTWESIRSQTYGNWSLVFVIGESQDGTTELARELETIDHRISVILQKGSGIYHAMNIGIESTTSPYVWFMNAGDCFFDEHSLGIAVEAAENSSADVIMGGHQVVGEEKRRTYIFRYKQISQFSFAMNRRFGCHQSMLFRTKSLRDVGCYDLGYKICSDFDAVLKILLKGRGFRLNAILSRIEPGGGADKEISFVLTERQVIREKNLNFFAAKVIGNTWTQLAKMKLASKLLKQSIGRFVNLLN